VPVRSRETASYGSGQDTPPRTGEVPCTPRGRWRGRNPVVGHAGDVAGARSGEVGE
jgi:hypothetical protein